VTFLGRALYGLVAGGVGTLAMDLVWFARYKRSGGKADFLRWETAIDLKSWDDAPAPAKVGKLLYESITHRELPDGYAVLTTNLMHWGYGSQWGLLFALSVGSPARMRPLQAPLLGALVWLASYVSLPVAGFYKPIWSYSPETLWEDLSAHLVYGTATATTFWLAGIPDGRRHRRPC
jgi:hypothetical protein